MSPMLPARFRPFVVLALLLCLALLLPGSAQAQACPPFPPYYSTHDRFGYNVVLDTRYATNATTSFPIEAKPLGFLFSNGKARELGAGWYLDYRADSGPVHGLSYLRVIRLPDLYTGARRGEQAHRPG